MSVDTEERHVRSPYPRDLRLSAPTDGPEFARPLVRASIQTGKVDQRYKLTREPDPFAGWEECDSGRGSHLRGSAFIAVSSGTNGVQVSAAAVRLLAGDIADGEAKRVGLRVLCDASAARLAIIPTEPKSAAFVMRVRRNHNAKFGGPTLIAWLAERGFGQGRHPATWDGKLGALIVERAAIA